MLESSSAAFFLNQILITLYRSPNHKKNKNTMKSIHTSIFKISSTFFALLAFSTISMAQDSDSPFVNFDQFEALVKEVKEHRSERMLPLDQFNKASQEANTIILDTRSKAAYDAKHIKGAIHLNFSDFTQASLDVLIESKETRILIYCNNNIEENPLLLENIEEFFPSKMAAPVEILEIESDDRGELTIPEPTLTLALNIPTYINLYGYGYKNVYELKDLVLVDDSRIQFEGTSVVASN